MKVRLAGGCEEGFPPRCFSSLGKRASPVQEGSQWCRVMQKDVRDLENISAALVIEIRKELKLGAVSSEVAKLGNYIFQGFLLVRFACLSNYKIDFRLLARDNDDDILFCGWSFSFFVRMKLICFERRVYAFRAYQHQSFLACNLILA